MPQPKYNPTYDNHWALVVGVNEYRHEAKLDYACNDANVFAQQLIKQFGFPLENVQILLDGDATLPRIQQEMDKLHRVTGDDDRVVIFYAGHGHTVTVNDRDFGFLIPVEGDSENTCTLLPWDDLVHRSCMIRAKHVLFIMDACYSGLMAMRGLRPGGTRFVHDMMARYSRQVLAAGKGNQVVADGGGPRNGHSIFTGYLLDALSGFMPNKDGMIHAEAVMAYVYDKVAKDNRSQQSPHRTQFAGDGDFFFTIPDVPQNVDETKDTENLLIEIPTDLSAPPEILETPALRQQLETYLSDQQYRIPLHNLVKRELRIAQERLGEADFSVQGGGIEPDDFVTRLKNYEEAVSDLLTVSILLGRWADQDQQANTQQIVHVLAGEIEPQGGLSLWLALRSYPMLLAMYSGGMAAIDGENYISLHSLFTTSVRSDRLGKTCTVLEATVKAMLGVNRKNAFKLIPEFEKKYTPSSEYLFMRLQPIVEDVLQLGSRYEHTFDRFELLYALCHADLTNMNWGHPGRFAWKYNSHTYSTDPFSELLEEANRDGDDWLPLSAGLFGGSYTRFVEVANGFKAELLDQLQWR